MNGSKGAGGQEGIGEPIIWGTPTIVSAASYYTERRPSNISTVTISDMLEVQKDQLLQVENMWREAYANEQALAQELHNELARQQIWQAKAVYEARKVEEKEKKMDHEDYEDITTDTDLLDKVWGDREYFNSRGYCQAHDDHGCEECTIRGVKEMSTNKNELQLIVAEPEYYHGKVDPTEAKKRFDQKIKYIQAGLDLSDKAIQSMKVKDIDKKMQEANEKMTVGKLKKLSGESIKPVSNIEKFFKWLRKVIW